MRKFIFTLFISFLIIGCGSKSNMESFTRQEVDLGFVNKIAVIPFENNSNDKFAADRVRDMTITQVLAYGIFDVIDKGLVDSALREEAVDITRAPMDKSTIRRLGQRLNIQAFMMGSIDQAEDIHRGSVSFPELALTLRLIDVDSGMIFWQASGNENGDSFGKRIFGLSADDQFKVALKLIRQLLSTISIESTAVSTDGEEDNNDGDDDALDTEDLEELEEDEDFEGIEILEEQG